MGSRFEDIMKTMNTKRFLFCVEKKYTERDKKRWGIQELESNGHQVDVINLNSLVHPKRVEEEPNKEIFKPESCRELDKYISKIEEKTVVVLTSINSIRFLPIIKIFNKYNLETIVLQLAPIPIHYDEQKKFSKISIVRRVKCYFMHLIKKCFRPYVDYLVKGGNKTDVLPMYCVGKEIMAHSMDFQKCQDVAIELSGCSKKHILFLDQNLMGHPDDEICGFDFSYLSDDYFRKINDFFDYVESKFETKVVIAAHPTSDLEKLKRNFNNRATYAGALESLAKESAMIFSHASTSMGVAVIYNKPLLLLDSKELREIENAYERYVQSGFATKLGAKVVAIDNRSDYEDLTSFPTVNFEKYKKYSYDYLNCSPSENGSIWNKIQVGIIS